MFFTPPVILYTPPPLPHHFDYTESSDDSSYVSSHGYYSDSHSVCSSDLEDDHHCNPFPNICSLLDLYQQINKEKKSNPTPPVDVHTMDTDPPQTDPPQTSPPQTNPPQTDPPQTNPPQTDPPPPLTTITPPPDSIVSDTIEPLPDDGILLETIEPLPDDDDDTDPPFHPSKKPKLDNNERQLDPVQTIIDNILPPCSPIPIPTLLSTGLNNDTSPLPKRTTDTHYLFQETNGYHVRPKTHQSDSWSRPSPSSSWIGIPTSQPGAYTARTFFDLSNFNPQKTTISFQIQADDVIEDILLNNKSISNIFPIPRGSTTTFSKSFKISPPDFTFEPGINEFAFVWTFSASTPSKTPVTGIRVLFSSSSEPKSCDQPLEPNFQKIQDHISNILSSNPSRRAQPTPALEELPSTPKTDPNTFVDKDKILHYINEARSSGYVCGLTPFTARGPIEWSDLAAKVSQVHSDDMATNNFFSHTGSDGSSPAQRAKRFNMPYRGENINLGAGSEAKVVSRWLNSPPHCQVIMKAKKAIGVARNGRYWTLMVTS